MWKAAARTSVRRPLSYFSLHSPQSRRGRREQGGVVPGPTRSLPLSLPKACKWATWPSAPGCGVSRELRPRQSPRSIGSSTRSAIWWRRSSCRKQRAANLPDLPDSSLHFLSRSAGSRRRHRLGCTPSMDTPGLSQRARTLRAASYPASISCAGSPPRIGCASCTSGRMTMSGGPHQ